ncbi:aminotransferase class I/II-fold pyridoxal phosphate-dependent enzyme [Microbacterium oleivorans]|uniref:Aminotransferase class I/II-fold pyridoxal phosphate-dependent enzyme n=1 Tax=Microbacterium oleivorans TaxID=273677 RepID=A0A7D5IUF4_9MICO|nr:aminotransferase class I/II-fold pyridoxal phosphate-dependent enzyme [Microbacterium oleivorans]QLD13017.1 aminotransferase class I/II-fold pyridoxal phosphate-dependent enzyme [Microbacterium oleivorans]
MTSRDAITGHTAGDIADSVRMLLERGVLRADDALPPVRALADDLGVNRNTVVAAYRLLAQAGVVVARGRGGTRIADIAPIAAEGMADTVLRDVGSGNPDPTRIPDPSGVLARVAHRPVLYGEPVVDHGLEAWARAWFAADARAGERVDLTVTGGAVDAVERLLAQALTRDDAVALEDPCFLASIHTVRLAGYRAIPVPVDAEGMTVAGLRDALAAGARAVVITPRAQNPTGASLSDRRAAELRAVLSEHPYVLIIEDDHFSLLSTRPYRSVIGPEHRRWARVRSVSKFLGPDMCLAVTASDPVTAERMSLRLGSGTTWVSHLLQRLAHALLTDDDAVATIAAAREHYAARNSAFADRLSRAGLACVPGDGLSLWVEVPGTARTVADALMRRGWLARTGDEFRLSADEPSRHLRLTVHDLDDDDADALARDLAAAALTPSRKV